MRRVLLLVCLFVSVVELDWEREPIYWFSSTASLLLVLYGELMRRRKVQRVTSEGVSKTGQDFVAADACISDSPSAGDHRKSH